jgi:dienelactone hydrolase
MNRSILVSLLTALISIASAQESMPATGEYTARTSVVELLGEEAAGPFREKIAVDQSISWEVFVPENYDPANPAGVLVFINSRNSGNIEPEWKAVMERFNLIYIGANESGNEIDVPQRVAYAILAPRVIHNSHAIDPERIYVSGFSGGSRVASMVATEYNRLFKGAIYNSGANFWGEAAAPRHQEMSSNHYVFIAGTEDFNLEDTREVYQAYQDAGISNSKLMVIRGMAHKRPAAVALETAIKYLDQRLFSLPVGAAPPPRIALPEKGPPTP